MIIKHVLATVSLTNRNIEKCGIEQLTNDSCRKVVHHRQYTVTSLGLNWELYSVILDLHNCSNHIESYHQFLFFIFLSKSMSIIFFIH
jgi:hypothetical protein